MHYCVKHCIQTKVREREKNIIDDSNNQSDEHVETDENDDSSAEVDVDSRFSYVREVHDEAPVQKKNIP